MQSKIKVLNRHSNLLGYRLFSISVKEFIRDDCFTLSLSISFVFLLSIIPFSTLSILIFNVLQNLSFSQTNWAGRITEMLADELIQIIPFVSKEWVKTHVINLETYGSFRTINFLMLPIISGLIFKTLETSYRRIFRLPARHLLLGQVIYITMSIFAVLLFFILNFVWIILVASLPHLFTSVNKTPYFANLYETVRLCAAYQPIHLLSALILIMFYLATIRLFLNIKIRFRYRLFSGILFCLLWTFARKFFGIYIQHISEINVLYGSLSSVIVILMWVFYSAIALLFSIEVMFVLHSENYRWRWW